MTESGESRLPLPLPKNRPTSQNRLLSAMPHTYVGPSADFIAPSSGFIFSPQQVRSLLTDRLPSRSVCDRLMDQYWEAVHTVATIVHKPSFERQYVEFWDHIMQGREPPASQQATLFAAIFSAAVSMDDAAIQAQYGLPRSSLVERLQSSVEMALSRSNFLRTTKLETMQALVMYLVSITALGLSIRAS